MNDIMSLLMTAILVVMAFTGLYKLAPFKKHKGSRPKFTFFPKYISPFDNTLDQIESSLAALEFKKNGKDTYTRGKIYGDFSIKAIRLSVEVNEQSRELKVYASFFGILFDTGDVWQVTTDILSQE